jgi:hexosaminidase
MVVALLSGVAFVLSGCGAGSGDGAGASEREAVGASSDVPSLIPQPKLFEAMKASFTLSSSTPVVAASEGEGALIAKYFADLTSNTTPLKLRVASASATAGNAIRFELSEAAPAGEGYTLNIAAHGATIRAREPRGLFYGAVSLWQLITAAHADAPGPAADAAGVPNATVAARASGTRIILQGVRIEDAPRFAWRGLMLDVARHYLPPDGVKQLLDQMALHKLNTFHWHLTDDQGWRIEIKRYPRLTEVGAWRVPAGSGPKNDKDPATGQSRHYGGYYTQDEIRDIVRYAAERYITIVPEIEMPGHAQAPIAAYPELGTEGPTPAVSSEWGVHNYLYNVDESTFAFLENVLTEVMALFPGQYIHIGGDEAVKDRWRASARVQKRMRELGVANEVALQSYFTRRMEKFLSSHGRKLIGWDEILEGGLPSGAAVMSWRGEAGAIEAVKGGHDVVMSPVPALYLDYLQSDGYDEPAGRPTYSTLKSVYEFNVVPKAIAAEAARHVIGAQVNAWTEHMRTPERMQHAVFPRIAALAEVVWSPPQRRDWKSFVERLPAQFARYEQAGIHFADSAFAVRASIEALETSGAVVVELSNQAQAGEIRYTTDGSEPAASSPLYSKPFTAQVPSMITAATFQRKRRVSTPRRETIDRATLLRRNSDQLQSCSDKLQLRLEDDAPRDGPRAVFKVDILDPCWTYTAADLSRVKAIEVAVGQIPFNFQVGDAVKGIPLHAPRSREGELEVRLGSCDGERIAVLPLAPAVADSSHGITALPAAKLAARPGAHDLCLRFTRRAVDPMWVIDSVQLVE